MNENERIYQEGDHIKEIDGYEDYLIFDDGRVWSKKRKKFLKPSIQTFVNEKTGHKYLQARVQLWKHGIGKRYMVHRLVAMAFLPNPENKPVVNHLDEFDTLNNSVQNLQWATLSENRRYGTNIQRSAEHRTGRIVSEETKQNLRKIRLGSTLSKETKKKIGEKSLGRRVPTAIKKKLRDNGVKRLGVSVVACDIETHTPRYYFRSVADASRFVHNSINGRSPIRKCIKGEINHAYGFWWRYVKENEECRFENIDCL